MCNGGGRNAHKWHTQNTDCGRSAFRINPIYSSNIYSLPGQNNNIIYDIAVVLVVITIDTTRENCIRVLVRCFVQRHFVFHTLSSLWLWWCFRSISTPSVSFEKIRNNSDKWLRPSLFSHDCDSFMSRYALVYHHHFVLCFCIHFSIDWYGLVSIRKLKYGFHFRTATQRPIITKWAYAKLCWRSIQRQNELDAGRSYGK